MSFKSVLEDIAERQEGILAAVVIADDGIIVERQVVEEGYDVELASVEYVGSCRDIRKAMESIESGALQEVTVVAEKTAMVMRSISPGYFLLVIQRPESSLGKCRYLLKKASYELAPEFM